MKSDLKIKKISFQTIAKIVDDMASETSIMLYDAEENFKRNHQIESYNNVQRNLEIIVREAEWLYIKDAEFSKEEYNSLHFCLDEAKTAIENFKLINKENCYNNRTDENIYEQLKENLQEIKDLLQETLSTYEFSEN